MTDDDRILELLNRALALTVSERALIAAELAASLDAPDADPDWLPETRRRIQEVEQGAAAGADWGSIAERIHARLRAARE
ncbi:MAG: addiction module protein [Planctomycetota bacterium]